MLSTPTPARTIALSRDWPSRTSAVSCVPERIDDPVGLRERLAQSRRDPAASLVLTTTSIPGSARSCASPSSASLSVTSTRCVAIQSPIADRSDSGERDHAVDDGLESDRCLDQPTATALFWPISTCCAAVTARPGSTS